MTLTDERYPKIIVFVLQQVVLRCWSSSREYCEFLNQKYVLQFRQATHIANHTLFSLTSQNSKTPKDKTPTLTLHWKDSNILLLYTAAFNRTSQTFPISVCVWVSTFILLFSSPSYYMHIFQYLQESTLITLHTPRMVGTKQPRDHILIMSKFYR